MTTTSRPRLVTDACLVWIARVPGDTADLVGDLDPIETDRRARLRRPADRDRFTAAAVLLRRTLAAVLDSSPGALTIDRTCDRCGEPHGRPVVLDAHGDPTALEVSVSHAGAHVAVALCHGRRVGVDIETIPLEFADLLTVACSPEEVRHITDAREFAVTWTRKEAFLKATGEGLRRPPAEVVVSAAGEAPAVTSLAGRPPPPSQMADLQLDREHVGALAVLTDTAVAVEVSDGAALLAGD